MTAQPEGYRARFWGPRRSPDGKIDLSPPLRSVWSRAQVVVPGLPFVDQGRLYLPTRDRRTVAEDEQTADELWVSDTPGAPCMVCPPFVLTVRAGGFVQGLDLDTGDRTVELGKVSGCSCAVSQGAYVVYGWSQNEWCYSLEERRHIWKHSRRRGPLNAGLFGVGSDCIVNSEVKGLTRCFELTSGKQRWEGTVADLAYFSARWRRTEPGEVRGPMAIFGDTTIFCVKNHHVVSLALQTGDRRWVWGSSRDIVKEGFLYGDEYYVLLGTGEVCVLKAETGALQARLDLQTEATRHLEKVQVAWPLVVSETHVWVGSLQGLVIAFKRLSGEFSWAHQAEEAGRTDIHGNTFVVARGRLYFADDSARVHCLAMTAPYES